MRITTAGDIMHREIFTFPDDATVTELARYLMEKEVSGVPVVDTNGKLVGVVSVTDISEERAEGGKEGDGTPAFFVPLDGTRWNRGDLRGLHIENEGRLVRDIMTPTVYTIPEETLIKAVARTMVAGRIHRLLVTRKGSVVGIVTTLDLLGVLAGLGAPEVDVTRELSARG